MSFKRYVGRDRKAIVKAVRLKGYYDAVARVTKWAEDVTFEAHRRRLPGSVRYQSGYAAADVVEVLTCDSPAPVAELDRVRLPSAVGSGGAVYAGTSAGALATREYTVTSVIERPDRGVVVIECKRNN